MLPSAATTCAHTEAFSDLLQRKYGDFRSAAKRLARAAGSNETSARNWLQGRNLPGFNATIELMRQDEDVFDLVCRLADRAPNSSLSAEERTAIEAAVSAMRRL